MQIGRRGVIWVKGSLRRLQRVRSDPHDNRHSMTEWAVVDIPTADSHFAEGANIIRWSYCGSPYFTSWAESSFGPVKVSSKPLSDTSSAPDYHCSDLPA